MHESGSSIARVTCRVLMGEMILNLKKQVCMIMHFVLQEQDKILAVRRSAVFVCVFCFCA